MGAARVLVSCALLGIVGITYVRADSLNGAGVQGPERMRRSSNRLYTTYDCPGNRLPPAPQPPAPVCPPGTRPLPAPVQVPYDIYPPSPCPAWVDEWGFCHVNNQVLNEDECLERYGERLYEQWKENGGAGDGPPASQPGYGVLNGSPMGHSGSPGSQPGHRFRRTSPTGNWYPPSREPGFKISPTGNRYSSGSEPGYDVLNGSPTVEDYQLGMEPGYRFRRTSPTGNRYPPSREPGSKISPTGNRYSSGSEPGYDVLNGSPTVDDYQPGMEPGYRFRRTSPMMGSPPGPQPICIPAHE